VSATARGARLFVPGRIEVLGKHTDYAGGRSLLAAVDRGFTVAAAPDEAAAVTVVDTAWDESVVVPLDGAALGDGALDDGALDGGALDVGGARAESAGPDWAVYPRTVVRRVARDFPGALRGCRIELSSDLPSGAGLSSSSALVTAVFLALDAVCELAEAEAYRAALPDRAALAGYLGAVERGAPFPGLGPADAGVGTRGGAQDHTAILCAEPGQLVRYAFGPVRREGAIPLPGGRTFAVGVSGVRAEKTGPARERYNRLSDRAARVVELWRSAGGEAPHLGAILETAGGFERVREVIRERAGDDERESLLRRVRHFAAESGTHVPEAAAALADGDIARFAEVVDRSQNLAERLLENQVPETVHLARSAREIGAPAASAFGAGFGGAVWALVPTGDAVFFLNDWKSRYRAAFPDRADAAFFTTPAAPPARTLE
jgi:galactokinase